MDLIRLKGLAARDNSALREAVLGIIKHVWTSVPAIITKDSDGHIATAQSAIKAAIILTDGTKQTVEMPLLDTSPVHFPGGGGVTHTHPVKKGDEGLVLFSTLPQDQWHKEGGVQDPIDMRRNHLSDSRWLPGGRSDPRKLNPPPSTTSQQNRADDGTHVWDLHPTNGLTAASKSKHLVIVGGSSGSGTLHTPGQILKNAAQVLINCVQQSPLPPPGNSFANRKLIALKPIGATSSIGSTIASAMSSVLSGGQGAIFSNPIASQSSSLQTAITNAVSSLTGVAGSSSLVTALTGTGQLSAAVTSNNNASSFMSGSATTGGTYGLQDLINHAQNLSQFWGSITPPASVALNTAMGPLLSGAALSSITTQLNALIASVVATTTTVASATTTVNGWTTQIASILSSANTAISTLASSATAMSLVLQAASLGASLDPNEAAVGNAIAGANLTPLIAAVQSLFSLSGSGLASAQSFPDSSATSSGATGGM
jgi:hypothetical protein